GLGDAVIDVGNMFDQIVISFINKIDILLWHISDFISRSKLIILGINDRLLINNVELAAQLMFAAQRQQNRPRVRAEFLVDAVDRHLEVRTYSLYFVYDCKV